MADRPPTPRVRGRVCAPSRPRPPGTRNIFGAKFGLYSVRAARGAPHAQVVVPLTTSESRRRPRQAGSSEAAARPTATRKSAAGAKKKPASRKPPAARVAKPAAAKPAAAKRVAKPKPSVAAKPAAAPRVRRAKPAAADQAVRLRGIVIGALDKLKARDVQEIDVRGKSPVTDLLVVASGTSTRHVKSLADEVVKQAKQAGLPPLGVEGQREAEWVLVDLGDVIVHVMLPRTREFYGLERLWTVGEPAIAAAG